MATKLQYPMQACMHVLVHSCMHALACACVRVCVHVHTRIDWQAVPIADLRHLHQPLPANSPAQGMPTLMSMHAHTHVYAHAVKPVCTHVHTAMHTSTLVSTHM